MLPTIQVKPCQVSLMDFVNNAHKPIGRSTRTQPTGPLASSMMLKPVKNKHCSRFRPDSSPRKLNQNALSDNVLPTQSAISVITAPEDTKNINEVLSMMMT